MTTPGAAEFLRLADSLATWGPAEPVPEGVVSALPSAIDAAERALQRANPKDFAVCMDDLVGWIERSGLTSIPADHSARRAWMASVVRDYRDGLADLPADLLELAVKRTKGVHRWRTMPMPADLRATVEGELSRRHGALRRLKLARDTASRQSRHLRQRPVTEDERERAAKLMEDFRRNRGLRVVNGGRHG
jgi:hypothetical protein